MKWSIAIENEPIASAIKAAESRKADLSRYQVQHLKTKGEFEAKAAIEQREIDKLEAKILIEDITIGSLKALQEGFVAHAVNQTSD